VEKVKPKPILKSPSPKLIMEASVQSENGSESAFEEPVSKKVRAKQKAEENRNAQRKPSSIESLKRYEYKQSPILNISSRTRPQR
jgi:hypothetical protein